MAREIYNKNAREKVLLEQAYAQVYTETSSVERIRRQMEGHPEHGDLFKHPKYGKYLYALGEYGRSSGPGNEPPNPTSPYYDLELSDAQVYRDGGYPDAAEKVEQAFGAESEEGGAINGNEIELTNDPSAQQVQKKAIPLQFRIAEQPETVQTLEGAVEAPAGAYIMTGTKGENWPIPADKFKETYDIIDKQHAAKKPIPVPAKQMDQNFFVTVSWSPDKLQGKPGDWLVQYGPGDYGVVEAGIFDETYDLL